MSALAKLFGRFTTDEFLEESIAADPEDRAEVKVGELRNLLIHSRVQERELKKIKEKMELLQFRNVALKQELTEIKTSKLEVVGLDIFA